MALIDDSLRGLVHALHRREELVLVEGVEISVVAEALVNALAMRKGLGHLVLGTVTAADVPVPWASLAPSLLNVVQARG